MNWDQLFGGQIIHNGIPTSECCGYQCPEHAPVGHCCNCPCDCADDAAEREEEIISIRS